MKSKNVKWIVMAALFLSCLCVPSWAKDPGLTDTTIKIGIFGPLTGAVSLWGWNMSHGAITIYNEASKGGGIHGRKVEVINMDDRCTPEGAKSAVKKLIFSDEVFLINGGLCSAGPLAARDEIIESKVPMVLTGATMDRIMEPVNRYVFSPVLPASVDGVMMVEFLMSKPGTKRLAMVVHPDEWGKSKTEKGLALLKEKYGLDLVASETMDRGATDATAQILRIKEAKPDGLLLAVYPAEAAIFCRDAYKYDLKVPFVATNAVLDLLDLRDRVGSLKPVENVYSVSYLYDSLSKFDDLAKIHATYFPKDKLSSFILQGMGSARVIVEGLKRAGKNLTREKFVDALETLKDFDTKILSSRITYTKNDHKGTKVGRMVTLVNGQEYYMDAKWQEGLK
ncbi:MAG: ABC transporter substrate-binding protein [Thermodesulfobacteriota bacterium]|jgi:branched-chain amino acid transport system substrate-binding protein